MIFRDNIYGVHKFRYSVIYGNPVSLFENEYIFKADWCCKCGQWRRGNLTMDCPEEFYTWRVPFRGDDYVQGQWISGYEFLIKEVKK